MIAMDPSFPEKVLWSDEAKFHLNGTVNCHNCVYWRDKAPEVTAISKGISVWCGMHSRGILGPVFIEENINAENYLEILKRHVIPFCEEQFEEMVFQQDEAPAHYANTVRNLLNESFLKDGSGDGVSSNGPQGPQI